MRNFFCVLLLVTCSLVAKAGDYEDAWKALNRNDRKTARSLLEKALRDPASASDAYLTLLFLNSFDGTENTGDDFRNQVADKLKDPSAYLYALWFNNAVLGPYGKKRVRAQQDMLEYVLKTPSLHPSLKVAGHYVKSTHYLFANQFEQSDRELREMEVVRDWQLTGPFENLAGTGSFKSHGPLEDARPDATFVSLTNARVQWFTPSVLTARAWINLDSHFPGSRALYYGQSFIEAPADMEVMLNVGSTGSVKVWVNDQLVIFEPREYETELDYYRVPCRLQKGYNRILVQLGVNQLSVRNWLLRFTDMSMQPVKGLKAQASYQPYTKATGAMPERVPHFAEVYFKQKIEREPANIVNYLLLSQVYLRNGRSFEARHLIENIIAKYPGNALLRFELTQSLLRENNRTLVSREAEWFKEHDADCYLARSLRFREAINEERYDDAGALLDEMIAAYGESESLINERISLLGKREKYDEMITQVQKAYERYPQNTSFIKMMYAIKKNANKDLKGAAQLYEKFLKDNFDYSISKTLAEEYIEQGDKKKGEKLLAQLLERFPSEAALVTDLVDYHFSQQDYNKALQYAETALKLSPYNAVHWSNKAVVLEQMGKKDDAAAGYRQALFYDAKQYDSRKKLRTLRGEPELTGYFPKYDPYEIIRKSEKNELSTDYNFSYLLDEKQTILYGDGAVEQYTTLIIRIHTDKGIDNWKEIDLSYNDNTQNFQIEKAEVIKKNGSKQAAETNGNQVVFTSLQKGDAIYVRYRTQDFSRGRLGREFWDSYCLGAFQPSSEARYSILAEKNVKFDHKMAHAEVKPQISEKGDFTLYVWELKDQPPLKEEPYMPASVNAAPTIHISTLRDWNQVAEWYSDISHVFADGQYELQEVFKEIFPQPYAKIPELTRARMIYNYIEKNIRYSHVPFRQSAFTPQKISTVLNTRLGDCKDLSSLFVALADMAGLKANMVLVNTRDNGTKDTYLPGVEFNHCIVLLQAGGKPYYIELTDNDMPFASLPYNLPGASCLVIPSKSGQGIVSQLKPVEALNRTPDKVRRTTDVSFDGADMIVNEKVVLTGALTSDIRASYGTLGNEKQREEMESGISGRFRNTLKMKEVKFTDLTELTDSVGYQRTFQVEDEISEVGEMQMVKVPFADVIATLDNFNIDKRQFALQYWAYEQCDEYETIVNIKAPAGKKLAELPADQNLSFGGSTYSIKFIKKAPDQLTIIRKAKMVRNEILPSDYAAFKKFISAIVKVESKYIAFK
ncbi:DUF3857 domain-containing protein [Terrimonas ferruginea]|uniref:DUF3857 domain-containing protein n=1 Tax=Terrimonas ferruginea TaxID=249 RepID=UPI00041B165D|nr:DUF3857 domain-containing protein [Terrimonas ferruginea]